MFVVWCGVEVLRFLGRGIREGAVVHSWRPGGGLTIDALSSDQSRHACLLLLSTSVRARKSLLLNAAVPPQIHKHDTAGAGEVEARAAGLEGREKDADFGLFVEFFDYAAPLVDALLADEDAEAPGFHLADFG